MPAVTAKASGKIILFGEHAVVYGFPAIAVPIQSVQVKVTVLPIVKGSHSLIKIRNLDWEEDIIFSDLENNDPIKASIMNVLSLIDGKPPFFELTISSSIPIAAGLGSSAALAIAITQGLSQFLGINFSKDQINELAFQSEKIQHGSPSGIDNSVISFGKPIYFLKGSPLVQIEIPTPLNIILGDSGKRTLTKDVVTEVKTLLDSDSTTVQPILENIGSITKDALLALQTGNLVQIGKLMSYNHECLKKIGVSSFKLNHLVDAAIKSGALGAKLCGGGQGGFMAALCGSESIEKISAGLRSAGAANIINTTIGMTGSKE
jgi:mevalonate kinase